MSDRLRERLHDADPVLARAAELVASVPATMTSEVCRARVRRAVLQTESRGIALPLLLRPGIAIPILLVAGAVMGATSGRPVIVQTYRRLANVAMSHPTPERAATTPSLAAHALPLGHAARETLEPTAKLAEPAARAPESVPAPAALPVAAATAPRNAGGARSPRSANRAVPAAAPPSETIVERATEPPASASAPRSLPQPAAAAPPQETALLMAAVRALRREHDPTRAGVLLDSYLRGYPHGVLAEEALALAIEAASARGDARASALAHTYLQRYPQGRFQRAARAAAQ